jgi:hypothetical protein
VLAATGDPKVRPLADFARQYAEQVNLLKSRLAEDALWSDEKSKPELLAYLKEVAELRADSVAPVIVKRIAYPSDPRYALDSLGLTRSAFPVYQALVKGGIPCIPSLVVELRKTYIKDRTLEPIDTVETNFKRRALLLCICAIYEEGSPERRPGASQPWLAHGAALAKKRLELELPETKDEDEKASLRAAIQGLAAFDGP